MRVSPWRQFCVAAMAIVVASFYASSAYAQRGRDGHGGSGGHGGGGGVHVGGGDGVRIGGGGAGVHVGGGDGVRIGGGWSGDGYRGGGYRDRGYRGGWSDGGYRGGGYRDRGYRGGWSDGGHWDRGYTSYYGRGWGYRPGFGWSIGIGDWYGGYYPYYGRWGGYGWGGLGDGYYSYWGPEYDTYSYSAYPPSDQAMPDTYASENQNSEDGKLPPLPSEKELSSFTNQQLQSFISWVARGFTKELGQYSGGDTWVKYFKLDSLRSIAPQPPRGQEMAAQQQQPTETISQRSEDAIRDVVGRMDSIQKDNQYQTVTNTWGFKALHAALLEASRPPEDRAASVLRGQTEILNKALERVSTGDSWRRHLEIDSLQRLANEKDPGRDQNVDKIAEKFDRVARNPEYQAIVQLPGFEGVYSSLRTLTDGREPASAAQREPPPPAATEVR